ncbi:hypothetical protein SEVIR_6G238200v4 [Setaria viridis]|uniref:Uncharacterized protein n=1 Tax=Setaria viridis TaxID=4556 RepID=A0A4U6UAW3_SETVI|nr:hypothetical protein SEVIR_6G238200v2 [Setaria viridis]
MTHQHGARQHVCVLDSWSWLGWIAPATARASSGEAGRSDRTDAGGATISAREDFFDGGAYDEAEKELGRGRGGRRRPLRAGVHRTPPPHGHGVRRRQEDEGPGQRRRRPRRLALGRQT